MISRLPSKPAPKSQKAASDGVVKIEMVAQAAGVSASTVSRILNGTAIVSEAKKKAVDEAIAQLGFVPNPMAHAERGHRDAVGGQPFLWRCDARYRRGA